MSLKHQLGYVMSVHTAPDLGVVQAGLGWAGLRTSNSSFPPFLCQIPVAAPVWSVSPVLTPWWTPAAGFVTVTVRLLTLVQV